MPLTFRILPFLLSLLPLFPSDKDAADDDAPGDQDTDKDNQRDADQSLGDAGKRALDAERKRADEADRKRKDLEKRFNDLEKKQREAAEAKAKEEGDYKQLLEDREKELADLKAESSERDLREKRQTIARKHEIPDDLVGMIQGDDDEAMTASAKVLAKHVNPGAVDTEAGSGRKGQTTKGSPRQLDAPPAKRDDTKIPAYSFIPDGAVVVLD